MSKQLQFFATPRDLHALVQNVLDQQPLHFIECGTFRVDPTALFCSPDALQSQTTYLALKPSHALHIQNIHLNTGETAFAIDQTGNPSSIVLRTGGVAGASRLLAGQLGTITQDAISLRLFGLARQSVRASFEKIKSYYVSPEAEALLDQGWRLTATLKSAPEYDLRR
jgi:hypothetical protein